MRESKIKGKLYRYDKKAGKMVPLSRTEGELLAAARRPGTRDG